MQNYLYIEVIPQGFFSNDYQIVIVLYKHFYSVYTNKKTDIRFELYKIKSIFVPKTDSSNINNNHNMKSKILSLAIIIAITIIALYCVLSGPETIILHWNIGGEAESYGSKYLILTLPLISLIIFLLIVNQEKHPYDTSLMSEKSRRNRNPKALRDIMPILLLAILYITACSVQIISMSSLVPFSLIIIAIILFNYKLRKSRKQ